VELIAAARWKRPGERDAEDFRVAKAIEVAANDPTVEPPRRERFHARSFLLARLRGDRRGNTCRRDVEHEMVNGVGPHRHRERCSYRDDQDDATTLHRSLQTGGD
jgi:hypothetical protein